MINLIKRILASGGRIDNEILIDYRNVFDTPEGRRVLTHMLMEMRFFDGDVKSDEGHILRNYATRLIQRIGALEPAYFVDSMISALMEIPLSDDEGNIERDNKGNTIIDINKNQVSKKGEKHDR